jgi:hypothetical protein
VGGHVVTEGETSLTSNLSPSPKDSGKRTRKRETSMTSNLSPSPKDRGKGALKRETSVTSNSSPLVVGVVTGRILLCVTHSPFVNLMMALARPKRVVFD